MNKLIALLIITSFVQSNELSLQKIEEIEDANIKITFEMDRVAYVNSYALENPSRIVLEVNQTSLKMPINEAYNYPIKKVRASSDNDLTRVVIDLYESVYWRKPIQSQADKNVLLELQIKKDRNLKKNNRDIIIAIDAGHGGKYPGAVGPNNILEKDVTLLIAKELERTLRDTKGYQAVMIRDNDETISLNERYQYARKSGADIFVSIHADGFRLESVKGASVFIWSDEASSTIAMNLSEKQRKRIQADIKNLKPNDFDEDAARNKYPEIYENKINQIN